MVGQRNILFDDVVYRLQSHGGISSYWGQLTSHISSRCQVEKSFQVDHLSGSRIRRFFPVTTRASVLHSSYFRFALSRQTKTVITVHDFLYELGYLKTKGSLFNVFQKKLAITVADAIICVSENTKKDLLRLFPNLPENKIVEVIHHGAPEVDLASCQLNAFSANKVQSTVLEQLSSKKYIVFVGKRLSYKNFESLVIGFSKSTLATNKFKLLCIGSGFSDNEKALLRSLEINSLVLNLENITDKLLHAIYSNAFALVYPSLYEGFGLPPLEAMACGCPVIASKTSSIPEVVDEAGILVEPQDNYSITLALEQLLNPLLRQHFIGQGLKRAKNFSWENAARQHIEIYKALI